MKYKVAIFFIVLLMPMLAMAQVDINPNEPVPVPTFGSGGCFVGGIVNLFTGGAGAPACQVTATGLILSIINIALAIVGLIAVLYVIMGGFRYVTAAGNEESAGTAKKTILHAVVGIAIVILSFVIVRIISNLLLFGGAAA